MPRCCCVLAIATRTPMDGDPFAFVEDLDRVGRDRRLDLLTGKAIGYGVKVLVDIDMIIETGPAYLPFRKDISLNWKRPQGRIIEFFKQLPSCAPQHGVEHAAR